MVGSPTGEETERRASPRTPPEEGAAPCWVPCRRPSTLEEFPFSGRALSASRRKSAPQGMALDAGNGNVSVLKLAQGRSRPLVHHRFERVLRFLEQVVPPPPPTERNISSGCRQLVWTRYPRGPRCRPVPVRHSFPCTAPGDPWCTCWTIVPADSATANRRASKTLPEALRRPVNRAVVRGFFSVAGPRVLAFVRAGALLKKSPYDTASSLPECHLYYRAAR